MQTVNPALPQPTVNEIVSILQKHPLIRLKEPVTRAFLVGSFAGGGVGQPRADSGVDVLLEVPPRQDMTAPQLEEHYRQALRTYFMKNDLRGHVGSVHPQWAGRRVEVYFTYDADAETRPKRLLPRKPEFMSVKELREPEEFAAEDVLDLAMKCVGDKMSHKAARRKLERLAAKRRAGTLRLYGQAPLLEVLSTKPMMLLAAEVVSRLQGFAVAPEVTKAIDDLATVVGLPQEDRAPVFCRCLLDVIKCEMAADAGKWQHIERAMNAPEGCQFVAALLAYVESSPSFNEYLLTDLERGLYMTGGKRILEPEPQALFTQARMRIRIREAPATVSSTSAPAPARRRPAV